MTPPSNLNDTVWFATGCSSGLGKSFAQTIYKAGHRIVATARNVTSLSYLPDEPNVLKLELDVRSQGAITSAFAAALRKFSKIHVVINNAGYGLMGDMESISEFEGRDQLETNFWGPVNITQKALQIFRGKFALEGFTKAVVKEVRPEWNIHFLIASPGGMRTNFAQSSLQSPPRHAAYDSPNVYPISINLE
ncbi:NAD(P)-binding protein [Penicillium malachiteum]|uniref:NAD(P)-binding protein n=1 Tax=Penicillium malachiteum TaxID=1324776 RepID=A0AAD6MQS0_9EURO|nr:NAD(P)-binding protein [Penicillium malachiteum]